MSITIGLIVFHAILLVFMLLLMLNGYLRGALKTQTDVILSFIIIGLLVFIGFKFGLIEALVSIPICIFIYGPLTNPLARNISFRILGYRTILSGGLNDGKLSIDDLLSDKPSNNEKFLNFALKKPSIQEVLRQYGKTEDDFKEQFWMLMASGLGDISYNIISNPKSLSLLFQLKEEGVSDLEIVGRFLRM